jgi:hypothetical protein
MTVQGLRLMLLVFALAGFAGAGASFAAARYRYLADGVRDWGLAGVTLMLFVFGALCTLAASGVWGVLAFGAVITGAAYLITAQHIGMFHIETPDSPAPPTETETGEEAHRSR